MIFNTKLTFSQSLSDGVESSQRSQCVKEALVKFQNLYEHFKTTFESCGSVSVNVDEYAQCTVDNGITLQFYGPQIGIIEDEVESCIKAVV